MKSFAALASLTTIGAFAALTLVTLPAQAQTIVDSVGGDVTVLKAFLTNLSVGTTRSNGASIRLDVDKCAKLSSDGFEDVLNCNDEFRSILSAVAGQMNYPLARDITLRAETSSRYSQYYCTLMEIQTVTPEAALPGIAGIGFSFGSGLKTIAGDALARVNTVTLKDGRSAAVHAFLAPVACWAGSVTSSSQRVYEFKPFALFNGLDGNAYRVWDAVTENYRVSYSGARGFDRSSELLAP